MSKDKKCPRCGLLGLEKAYPPDAHCHVMRATSRCYKCKYLKETAEGYYKCLWKPTAPLKCRFCGYKEKKVI